MLQGICITNNEIFFSELANLPNKREETLVIASITGRPCDALKQCRCRGVCFLVGTDLGKK